MPLRSNKRLLLKPPLDHHRTMASQAKPKSTFKMSPHLPLLGFNVLVAPLNKIKSSKSGPNFNSPLLGNVHQLCGAIDASTKMAPDISSVIRGLLQKQQISPEASDVYLRNIVSLQRYNYAFKKFWSFCHVRNVDLSTATLPEIASELQLMSTIYSSESKNAYAALLKIPGLDQLKFSPLLQNCKTQWQTSIPKYATFWEPEHLIKQLLNSPLNWKNVTQVRDRLIISLRIFIFVQEH